MTGCKLYGATALYLAAQNGRVSAVKQLLSRGAAVDAQLNQIKVTALFIAAERGHVALAELLIQQGAA